MLCISGGAGSQAILVATLLLVTVSVSPAAPPTPDVVTLPYGRGSVRGVVSNGTRAFRNIPYAKAPTGSLRWRPPAPAEPWPGEVLDARRAGPSCMQPPEFNPEIWAMSEDCLTLSVYTPLQQPLYGKKFPVMVWIHVSAHRSHALIEMTRLET